MRSPRRSRSHDYPSVPSQRRTMGSSMGGRQANGRVYSSPWDERNERSPGRRFDSGPRRGTSWEEDMGYGEPQYRSSYDRDERTHGYGKYQTSNRYDYDTSRGPDYNSEYQTHRGLGRNGRNFVMDRVMSNRQGGNDLVRRGRRDSSPYESGYRGSRSGRDWTMNNDQDMYGRRDYYDDTYEFSQRDSDRDNDELPRYFGDQSRTDYFNEDLY